MSDQVALAFGVAARALRRSGGTEGSGSTVTGAISILRESPISASALSRSLRSTLSQWPPSPSGESVAEKAAPLHVPSTETMPREGSFALAFFESRRKDQVARVVPLVALGLKSVAENRISFVVDTCALLFFMV